MVQGQYLRVKVRLQIAQPLMRGMIVQVGGGCDWKEKWCHFEYEYLPAFCYNCGIIGRVDKNCAMQVKRGEAQ
jgi:hypothetical protein